jgi:hypothetical protein
MSGDQAMSPSGLLLTYTREQRSLPFTASASKRRLPISVLSELNPPRSYSQPKFLVSMIAGPFGFTAAVFSFFA